MDDQNLWGRLLRSVLACVVSAYVGTAIIVTVYGLQTLNRGFMPDYAQLIGSAGTVALVVLLVVGLPAQAILQAMKRVEWFSLMLTGAVLGALLLNGFALAVIDDGDFYFEPFLLGVGAGSGAFYALILWLVRRPDRDGTHRVKALPLPFRVTALDKDN
ncbi:MAG: hypothetical protein QM667_11365 [Asticcacaulis sp.]